MKELKSIEEAVSWFSSSLQDQETYQAIEELVKTLRENGFAVDLFPPQFYWEEPRRVRITKTLVLIAKGKDEAEVEAHFVRDFSEVPPLYYWEVLSQEEA